MQGRHMRPLRSIAEVFRMVVRRWCAVLLFVVSGLSVALCAQQQRDQCATAIPPNIEAGVFVREMIALLRLSETFRSQCARLAQAPGVRVTIEIAFNLDSGRAQTAIHRYASGAIRAEVVVLFGENYRELLAHEFEHVLEQIDGVDLRQEAAQGRAWLLPGGVFETRRAFAMGVQVLREAEPVHAHAAVNATR
jgi:hypothetical protein